MPPSSDFTFLMNFGSRQGLPGGAYRVGRSTSPAVCFSTFCLRTVISQCVFDVFRITGFRYRWRERFPLEIYLSQRESRRSIPERQPVVENHTPRVPKARWRIYIYMTMYIYIYIHSVHAYIYIYMTEEDLGELHFNSGARRYIRCF